MEEIIRYITEDFIKNLKDRPRKVVLGKCRKDFPSTTLRRHILLKILRKILCLDILYGESEVAIWQ